MQINGIGFERKPDGSVVISPPGEDRQDLCLSAREWAQVVASVAKDGPDQNWMMQVLAIHGEAAAQPMPQLLIGR